MKTTFQSTKMASFEQTTDFTQRLKKEGETFKACLDCLDYISEKEIF